MLLTFLQQFCKRHHHKLKYSTEDNWEPFYFICFGCCAKVGSIGNLVDHNFLLLNKESIKVNIVQKIQGDWLERSKSYCLLLIKYENYELLNPTRGSPDVVHLSV